MKADITYYVIGGSMVDCVAHPQQAVHQGNSNVASIDLSFGGVANNIVRNLAYHQKQVKFLSVFSSDGYGQDMMSHLSELGVDLTHAIVVDEPSSMYLALMDEKGDLMVAMVDSSNLDKIQLKHLKAFLMDMKVDDVVVLDTNLDQPLLEFILEHAKGKVACDPISLIKAQKIKPYLKYLHVFTPNALQASALSEIEITDEASLKAVGQYFKNQGVEQTIITLGDQGGLVVSQEAMIRYQQPAFEVVSAIGAGDASLAAFIAFDSDYDKIETIKRMVACAYLTCLSHDSVNPLVGQLEPVLLDDLKLEIKKIG